MCHCCCYCGWRGPASLMMWVVWLLTMTMTWVMWPDIINVDDVGDMAVIVINVNMSDVARCRHPRVVQCIYVGLNIPVLFNMAAFGPPHVVSMCLCWARCIIRHIGGGLRFSASGSHALSQAFPATVLAYSRCLGGAIISGDKRRMSYAQCHKTGLPLSGSPLVIFLIPSFHPTTNHIQWGPHPSGEGRGTEGALRARMW